MTGRARAPSIAPPLEQALREFANALIKSAMYPPGHRFVIHSAEALIDRLSTLLLDRESFTIGVTPRGLLVDGAAVEGLPPALREFAVRLHRKNVGTVQFTPGIDAAELAAMLSALAASDADEKVGREGIRLAHIRVEPLTYDVLAFADPLVDSDIDDIFWGQLVEAAFGLRIAELESLPTASQIAEHITARVENADSARRVYQALAAFSTALAARGERAGGNAKRRFVDVLGALSRPTTARLVAAAPTPSARRRFLRETLSLVPPAVLMQVLESVADADGEPISPQLRWLLGKLAGGGGEELPADGSGAFASQVVGLVEQWDGVPPQQDEGTDPRLGIEPARVVAAGLDLGVASPSVFTAARALAGHGQLGEVLALLDHAENDPEIVRVIADAVLDPGLLSRLLHEEVLDFPLIERVVKQSSASAITPLVDALAAAPERPTRRRLLDLLIRIGPPGESALMARLESANWQVVRNILVVLSQYPAIANPEPIVKELEHPEIRVRQEALKVLVRQPATQARAVTVALEGGEESLVRIALSALAPVCPPAHVASVLSLLARTNPELQLQAVHVLSTVRTPLVVPQFLALVRSRSGMFRRLRLLAPTPVMLAALRVLATQWASHRPVVAVLQLAARSSDPTIRGAVRGDNR
ncbi:MAG TPA: hypothetical protein VGM20_10260 [Gemmatimonadales bacterium]|jgi:hypothetical protein